MVPHFDSYLFVYFRFDLQLFGHGERNISIKTAIKNETFDFEISGEPMKVGVVAKLNEDQNYELRVGTDQGNITSFVTFTGSNQIHKSEFKNSTLFPIKHYNIIFMEFANKINSNKTIAQYEEKITKTYKLKIIPVKWQRDEIFVAVFVFLLSLLAVGLVLKVGVEISGKKLVNSQREQTVNTIEGPPAELEDFVDGPFIATEKNSQLVSSPLEPPEPGCLNTSTLRLLDIFLGFLGEKVLPLGIILKT